MSTTTLKPTNNNLELLSPVILECGKILENVNIRYTTFGELNENKSNAVWIFHALTGNSNPLEWWDGLFSENSPINIKDHFIICANMLGSCYGSTGPEDDKFPLITIRDIVAVQKRLRDSLGIEKVKIGIGGSMGGQQLLEWATQEPDFFEIIIPIATNAKHSPWGIAFNEAQRMALDNLDKGKGLETARAIAMLSYRSYETYDQTQKDQDQRWDEFSASSYQRYQGEKLRKRFTSSAYNTLSKAMDSHNVGRHQISVKAALGKIESKTLVIGINSDFLFPPVEQKFLADHIKGAELKLLDSCYGHDGFLTETQKINIAIEEFLCQFS